MPSPRGLPILLGGQAMASMDASILVVAAPSVAADLHAGDGQLQLVVVMYVLAFAALAVPGARLGDVIGPRTAFVAGLAGFALASLVGGLAPDPTTLIVARALQGAAGAVMTPQVLSIIQRDYAGAARAAALRAYSLILAVGVAAGQIAGGLLVSAQLLDAAWRPALLINAPVGVVLLLAARRRLPRPAPSTTTTRRRRVDVAGAAILAATLLALVLPLTIGRDRGWPAWALACLALMPVGAAAFVAYERRVPRDPIFDLALLRDRRVAAGAVAVLTIMGSYAGFLFSLTLHLQGDLGFSPLRAGLTFAVYAAGFAAASRTWTRIPNHAADALPTAGPLVMALGMVAAGAEGPSTLPGLAALALAGAGHAAGYAPLTHRLAGCVTPGQTADLSGLLLVSSLVGSVLGTTALGALFLVAGDLLQTTLAAAAVCLVTAAAAALSRPSRDRPSRGRLRPRRPNRRSGARPRPAPPSEPSTARSPSEP
jgi:MFS family permease